MTKIKVANVKDVKEGCGKVVSANGVDIALFKISGKFYAIENTCPHKGGPLGEGSVDDSKVTCPWHGWSFDVKTGQNTKFPTIKQKRFDVSVDGDNIIIEI